MIVDVESNFSYKPLNDVIVCITGNYHDGSRTVEGYVGLRAACILYLNPIGISLTSMQLIIRAEWVVDKNIDASLSFHKMRHIDNLDVNSLPHHDVCVSIDKIEELSSFCSRMAHIALSPEDTIDALRMISL